MYQRILVATDGSTLSKKAVTSAIGLAALTGAELVALKVVPRYPQSYFEGGIVLQVSEVAPPQARAFAQVSATLVQDLSATRCAEQKERWFGELRAAARIERGEVAQ